MHKPFTPFFFVIGLGLSQFFAFFAYEPKSKASLQSSKVRYYKSHCEKTMVGWFHQDDNTKWGCFQAQKKGQLPWSPPQFGVKGKQQLEAGAIIQPLHSFLQVEAQVESQVDSKMFVVDTQLIDAINSEQNLWEAAVPLDLVGKTEGEVQILLRRILLFSCCVLCCLVGLEGS
jgi:hypothetical protein